MSLGRRRLAAIMSTDMVGYTALGQKDESHSLLLVDEQRKLLRPIERSNASSMNDLAYAYAEAGRKEEVRRVLADLLEMRKVSKRAAPAIAGVHTVLGEHDKSFERLEKGFEEHSPYISSIRDGFIFEPLRVDPRSTDLLRRIGLVSSQARG